MTRVTSNGSGNNELELLRERDYPFYKPAAGVGGNTASSGSGSGQTGAAAQSGNTASNGEQTGSSNSSSSHAHAVIGHEVITNKEPSTIQAPTASERERAGYFGNNNTSNKGTASAGTFRHSNSYAAGYTRPPYSIDASTAGIPTPSTSFGYSPAPPTAHTTDSSEAADSDVGDYEEPVQDNQHLHAPIQPGAAASPGELGFFQ